MSNTRKPADQRARIRQLVADAEALDMRRQKQIANQAASINRLLDDGSYDGSYDGEMKALHEQLAAVEAELQTMKDERERFVATLQNGIQVARAGQEGS